MIKKASRIPRRHAAAAKKDRLDAVQLATYYAQWLLCPSAISTVEQEGFRALVRRRKRIAGSRGKIKQKINGFLLASGIDEPHSIQRWSLAEHADLTALDLPPQHHMTLASMVRENPFLISEDKMLGVEIGVATERMHPETFQRLTSIVGVGETAASNFPAELLSPVRSNRSEEVTWYLGLAPVVRQSGGSAARVRIRPGGQKRLRGVLIEAARQWTWRDPEAKEIGNRHFATHRVEQKALLLSPASSQ